MAPTDFWADLSPEAVVELLQSAPKVAGPWRQNEYDSQPSLRRRALISARSPYTHLADPPGWVVHPDPSGPWGVLRSAVDMKGECYASKQDALDAADAMARAEGWVLMNDTDGGV